MRKRLKYIFVLMQLLVAFGAAGQSYVIDSLCVTTQRNYRIEGETGSTYHWVLTDAAGTDVPLTTPDGIPFTDISPTTGLTIVGSEITINWSTPGIFDLMAIQYSVHGCDSIQIGKIKVYDPPQVFAGNPINICEEASATLSLATSTNCSEVAWTTSGDGTFDNPKALNPVYTPGTADLVAGTVTLTIKGTGMGTANTCSPASSQVVITITKLTATAFGTDAKCFGENSGTTTVVASGGALPYSYLWDDPAAQTTATATGLFAGTYQVKVTDANGCETTAKVTIGQPALPLAAAAAGTDVKCHNGSDGTTTASASGGTPPYTYLWNDPTAQTTPTAINLRAGTYSVKVTDANGCFTTTSVTITEPPVDLTVTISSINVLCYGDNTGWARADANNGVEPYTYLWDDPGAQTTENASGLLAGTYHVVVTDVNGCTATGTITITEPPQLITTLSKTDVLCFGGSDGTATAAPSGGTGPYTYLWNDPAAQKSATALNLAAGTYTVLVTDANGCKLSASIKVDQPAAPLTAITSGTDVNCYGGSDGTATATPSGGTAPYTYLWNDPKAQTGATATDLFAGTYQVKITDANGCETTATQIINQPAAPLIAAGSGTDVRCFGGNDGTATVTATGGTPPYTYLWNDPDAQTTALATDLYAGIYIATVTDANGCTATVSVTINQPPKDLTVTITSTDVNCFGGNDGTATAAGADGVSPYSYLWNDPMAQTTAKASGLAAGTYTVIVTDANGCTATDSVTINEPPQLLVNLSKTDVLCFGGNTGTATALVSGGVPPYAFLWNDPAAQTTPKAIGLIAGTYHVKVTDAHGCIVEGDIVVNQPAAPLTATITKTDVNCFGGNDGTATVSPTGGTPPYTVQWNDPMSQTTPVAVNLTAGIYQATITDFNGCITSATITINQPAAPLASTMFKTDVKCFGGNNGTATATVSGGTPPYQYLWNDPKAQTTAKATGLFAGVYQLTVTDQKGCILIVPVIINQPPADLAASATSTMVSCFGGSNGTATVIAANGTPPYTYLWDDPAAQTTVKATGLMAGTYTVIVTDANGCTTPASATVGEPTLLTLSETHIKASCDGAATGSIDLTVSGGTAPYTYLWSNGAATQDIAMLAQGKYTVTVTDKNACSQSLEVTIEPDDLLLTEVHIDAGCDGAAVGSIDLTVSGGTPPYSYSWNNGATTQDMTGLISGNYSVIVKDSKGCENTLSVLILDPWPFVLSETHLDIGCTGALSGSIDLTVSGGSLPYTFLWSNGATTEDLTGLAAGTYTVTVTDDYGCDIVESITINESTPINIADTHLDILCAGESTGLINLTVSGGTAPYKYQWSNGKTTEDISGLAAGSYTVIVTDAKNCNIAKSITLTEPTPILITETHTDVGYSDQPIGSIDITVSGGFGPYTYAWSNGATTQDISGLTGGNYMVTVTDQNNCSQTLSINILQIELMTIDAKGNDSPCPGIDGSIDFTFTHVPDGVYDITYDGGTFTNVLIVNNKATVSAPVGTYKHLKLTVNSNSTVNTVNVTINQMPEMSLTATPVSSNCSNQMGSIQFTLRNVPDGLYDIIYDEGKFTGVQVTRNFAEVFTIAGTYTNLHIERFGCTSNSVTVNLEQPVSLTPIASAVQPDCQTPTGSITVTYPKFGKGYKYRIDDGIYQTSATFNDLAPGRTYKVQAIEVATDCETEPINVTIYNVPTPPDAPLATITTQPTCEEPTGTILVTYPLGNQYEYRVDGGAYQKSVDFTGLTPGDHQLTVLDRTTLCTTSSTININPTPPPYPVPVASITAQPDCYVTTGTIVFTDPAIGTGFQYSVDGVDYQDSNIFTDLVPGTYHLQVRSKVSKCTSEILELTIDKPIPPAIPIASVTNPDCNVSTGTITVNSPLGSNLVYSIDGGSSFHTSPVFGNLPAESSYMLIVRDNTTGCISDPANVSIGPIPEPLAAPVRISNPAECALTPIQTLDARNFIQPVSGITVIWYDAVTGGNVVTNPTLNSVNSVTYYAESFDGICRSETRTPVTMTIHPVPALPVSTGPIVVCEEFPIQTLNANAAIVLVSGISIRWYDSPTGGNLVTPTLSSVNTATYYAEAWNGYCASESRTPVTLTILPMPTAPVSNGDILVCETSPLPVLDARSSIPGGTGQNIIWYDELTGGNMVTNPTLNTVGSKTYYAVDFNGICTSAPRTPVTLTIYALPEKPTVEITVVPTCKEPTGKAEITSPIGSEYLYSADNGSYQTSTIFSNLDPGSHFFRVKNNLTGCESDTTRITIPDLPPLPHIIDITVENCICYGDSGAINFEFQNVADGTYVIIYMNGQFENVEVKDNKAKVVAPAGRYYGLSIEANGCLSTEEWNKEIIEPPRIIVSSKITEIDLKTNQKGEIDLTISGGTGNYNVVWKPNPENGFAGAITKDIANLNEGPYEAIITDANNCEVVIRDTIPEPNQSPIATNDEFNAKCSAISGDLLGNDYDPDGDSITIDTSPVIKAKHGTLKINPDGTFEYQADPGYTGDDSFQYVIFDVKKNFSTQATVVIHVIADFDCDGIPDVVDPDADGDGILNKDEGDLTTDSDGDGHPNWLDIDADNDGIVDNIEGQSTEGYIPPEPTDTDNDGINDAYDTDNGGTVVVPVDTDSDGIPDFLDTDADGDGVSDYIEGHDSNADGKIDRGHTISGKDADADGLDNSWDTENRYEQPIANITGSNAPIQDFDGDGIKDWRDENDDDDEYLTRFEDLNMDGDWSNDDTDHDGHPEYLDYGRDCDLFIPDAFSPNGDNIHDYFQIYCIEHYPNAKIYIFDQLGNLLFEKENYGNLQRWQTPGLAWWDGRTTNRAATVSAGQKVVPGTYFYVLKLGNGEVRKSFVFVSY